MAIYISTFVAAVVLGLIWVIQHLKNELKITKCQLEASEKEKKQYMEVAKRLRKESEIKQQNRRESDEKIESLHNGNSVDNALFELSKRAN